MTDIIFNLKDVIYMFVFVVTILWNWAKLTSRISRIEIINAQTTKDFAKIVEQLSSATEKLTEVSGQLNEHIAFHRGKEELTKNK